MYADHAGDKEAVWPSLVEKTTTKLPVNVVKLKPNLQTLESHMDDLMKAPVVKRGRQVHDEWGGPNCGDSTDENYLYADGKRYNPKSKEQPVLTSPRGSINISHPTYSSINKIT